MVLSRKSMERETGIEPALRTWKDRTLPLSYSRLIFFVVYTLNPY